MATARATKTEIKTLRLDLSAREAGVLLELLANVDGEPLGPREGVDSILKALDDIGVQRVGKASGTLRLTVV